MPIPVEVQLGAAPHSRDEAVRSAGALLVRAGLVEAPYVESLVQREAVAHTYLGQGLAIPHGMVEDRHLVRRTGLAVLQVPAGVAWGEDAEGRPQVAQLVVAIAADGDAHLDVLRRLTRLLAEPAALRALARSSDAGAVVAALTGAGAAPADTTPVGDLQHAVELTLDYPNGLHARPAGLWAQTLRRFDAVVQVRLGDAVADARSVPSLLGLGAGCGARLRLSAAGGDAQAALAALRETIQRLGLDERRQAELAAARQAQAQGLGRLLGDWQPESRASFQGVGASPGLVVGTLVVLGERSSEVADLPGEPAAQAAAVDAALAAAQAELQALVGAARQRSAAESAAIFEAQQALLGDAELLREVSRTVLRGHGAAWAWQRGMQQRVAAQRALADATLAARAADLQDVGRRVLRHLPGGDAAAAQAPTVPWPPDAILVADDLEPSVTAQIDPARVRGFCTARGGPTAHTAILARSLGLPAVVAAGAGLLAAARDGEPAILDGWRGRLHLGPSATARVQAQALVERLARQRAEDESLRLQPAATTDGHRVEIAANVNRPDQVADALRAGAEAVGLMRTEFLFLERVNLPDEDEQYAVYRDMVQALGGRPLIVRTLDIGGDKRVPQLDLPPEANPFLGVRGARLCLRRDDLLRPQLRALCRASRHGPLAVMFPMIGLVEEVRALRERLDAVRAELGCAPLRVGIMVEVPSAALLADRLAEHVDFFSIGTNDLTQYALAVDRQHPELATMADALHPAVLRLIARTVEGARRHGRWVGVCGGLAGEPLGAALLCGLGVHELSMSPGDIGSVKALLRWHTLAELQALALRALDCASADEVRHLGAALRAPALESA
jgi:phosphocarrier protein FPr